MARVKLTKAIYFTAQWVSRHNFDEIKLWPKSVRHRKHPLYMNPEYDNPDRWGESRRWTRVRPMNRAEWGEPDHRKTKTHSELDQILLWAAAADYRLHYVLYNYYIVITCKNTVDRQIYTVLISLCYWRISPISPKKSAQTADQQPKIAHKIWTAMTDSLI